MIKIIKNGVVVSVVLDTRTINKEGTYPVKIKVYYQGKPKYYSVGICLTSKEELEEALEGKSKECRDIQEEIGKELSRILKNVEYLAERGTFSFDRLNTRLGKNIGGTINEMLEAKIKELDENNKFGSKTFYQSTLSLIKRYKRNNVPIRDITVEWLRDFEKFCLKTVSQTTLAINMRNIRAIMNIAKSAGVIREADYPFGRGKYQIKEGVGKKKALNKKQLKAIANYSDGNKFTEFYRDLWLFIYFCNGINVADLINFKSDIRIVGVNSGLLYVPEKHLLFRTTLKRVLNREVVIQAYSNNDLILDADMPNSFKLLGFWDDYFYGVSLLPKEDANGNIHFIFYRFKIEGV